MEQLVASVRAGADAVYLGAGKFNARQSASNFDGELLSEAVAYCHERGVKLYLAMNTLLFDEEIEGARELAALACALGVDAVIVQDIGLAALLHQCAPDMPLHASTQMTIHNPSALTTLATLGFSRAILAREMTEQEISEMSLNSNMELEAFVHGALCMSVSGQCYLSAMLGSRSGNRGRCAQPCRLPFHSGGVENCLSLKDMSLIEHIDRMAASGVTSLKIEGRLKRPEYCAAAVTACRLARDEGRTDPQLAERLEAVFSRSGFTDGYFTGVRGAVMFGTRTREDVTAATSSVLASLHQLYKNEYQRVPLHMRFAIPRGIPATLTVSDESGNICTVSGAVPQNAEGRALDSEAVCARLVKTGGTPYMAASVDGKLDDEVVLPVSAINSLRRDALQCISELRRQPRPVRFDYKPESTVRHTPKTREYHALFRSAGQIPAKMPTEVRRVYLPLETDTDVLKTVLHRLEKDDVELALEAPRGLFGNEQRLREMLVQCGCIGIKRCMIHNIGMLQPVMNSGLVPVGGFGLNITNSLSLAEYQRLGLSETELSMELTVSQIELLSGAMPRGVMIYGYQPLMLTRNCPASLGGECGRRNGEVCTITDRRDIDFPVMCRMGCSEVFNSIPLSIVEKTRQLGSVDWLLMRFSVENSVETEEILNNAVKSIPNGNKSFTRGLFYRGVE